MARETKTFEQLRAEWESGTFEPGLEPFAPLLLSNLALNDVLALGPCAVSVFIPSQFQYAFLSADIVLVTGYRREDILANRSNFAAELIHREDIDELINQKGWNDAQFRALPPERRAGFIRRFFYRMLAPGGEVYKHYLEQNVVLRTDAKDAADLVLGIVTDISDHRAEASVASLERELRQPVLTKPRILAENEFTAQLNEQERFLIQEIANGRPFTEVCEQIGLRPRTVMAIMRYVIIRSESSSFAQLLDLCTT